MYNITVSRKRRRGVLENKQERNFMMIYTPQSIEKALVTIAEKMVIQYDAELKLTDPTAKTQRKALTIEREIARLCNHAGLNGFAAPDFDKHMTLADRQFRNVTGAYPRVTAYYTALSEADRHAVLPYLRSLYFMVTSFLIPWRTELVRAEEAGDAAEAFELKLKIGTVTRVLEARCAWWREHAEGLPAIPKDIRDGEELNVPMKNITFYSMADGLLRQEIKRLEAFCEALDLDREAKTRRMAEYKCAKYRYATVSGIHSMLYNCHRLGEKLRNTHYLLLPVDELFKKREDLIALYDNAHPEDKPDIGLYYGMMEFADFLIADTKKKLPCADDWERVEIEHRLSGYEFGKQCLREAFERREASTDEAKA